jgi:hypothetical protein
VTPEPERSSPCSQESATGPYPEPVESTPHTPANLPKVHSGPILPSTPRFFEWSLSFGLSHQSFAHFSLLSHACHMFRPSHPPWFVLPNDIWGWLQIMKFLNVLLPLFYCYFSPFRSKYSPCQPCSQTPQSMLFLTRSINTIKDPR